MMKASEMWTLIAIRIERGQENFLCTALRDFPGLTSKERKRLKRYFSQPVARDGCTAWWGRDQLVNFFEPARTQRVLAAGLLAAMARDEEANAN